MNVTVLTAPTAVSNWQRVGWILLLLGGLFAAGNAVMFMLVGGHGSPEIKERFFATAIAGWSHAFGGAIAALIGPFQMLASVRRSWPRVHVWMGRIYLTAVLAGGLAGLYFAPVSSAGIVGRVGFARSQCSGCSAALVRIWQSGAATCRNIVAGCCAITR